MLGNSLAFAVGAALLALVIGTVLAYIQVRTDTPFKGLFFAASLVPLIIPAILYAAAWIFLADPDIGLLNAGLKPIFGHGVLNVFSLWGMMWVQGLHLAPIAFLLMVAAFRAMDPSLEESGLMSGASRATVLRRITMPLLRPALVSAVLLMFVQSLESFEVPGLLGLQNGTYVFTSRIYFVLRSFPIDYGAAGAYALGLLAIAAVGVLVSGWLSRDTKGFQTISGKGVPAPADRAGQGPAVGRRRGRSSTSSSPWCCRSACSSTPRCSATTRRRRRPRSTRCRSRTTARRCTCRSRDGAEELPHPRARPRRPSSCSSRRSCPGWSYGPRPRAGGRSTCWRSPRS